MPNPDALLLTAAEPGGSRSDKFDDSAKDGSLTELTLALASAPATAKTAAEQVVVSVLGTIAFICFARN